MPTSLLITRYLFKLKWKKRGTEVKVFRSKRLNGTLFISVSEERASKSKQIAVKFLRTVQHISTVQLEKPFSVCDLDEKQFLI